MYNLLISRSRDPDFERFPKLLLKSLKQATTGLATFVDGAFHHQDSEKVIKFQKSLEQIR